MITDSLSPTCPEQVYISLTQMSHLLLRESQNILELERSGDLILCLQVNAHILLERRSFSSWNIFGKQSLTSTYNHSFHGLITGEQEVLPLIEMKSFLS